MNAIEDNEFSRSWRGLGRSIRRPEAVLSISAHWYNRGAKVTAMDKPRTIHDFFGFPKGLFEVEYPAPGSRSLAERVRRIVTTTKIATDMNWGLDHGTWSVLCRMYPRADVPVIQLSLDGTKPTASHFNIGKELMRLRDERILILGSGNIVHNPFEVDWGNDRAHPWALEFDELVKKRIEARKYESLIEYNALGEAARRSIPTDEHYLPMLYVLGAAEKSESVSFFNEKVTLGSVGMRSFVVGGEE